MCYYVLAMFFIFSKCTLSNMHVQPVASLLQKCKGHFPCYLGTYNFLHKKKKKKSLERVGGETKDQACCQLIRLSRALIREVWCALAFGSSELTISAISGNVMLLEASSAHV